MVTSLAFVLPGRNTHHTKANPTFNSQDALNLLRHSHNLNQLKRIHARIIRNGLSRNELVVIKMLRLCFSYKEIAYASLIFHHHPIPSTFAWNLMIRAHTLNGCSIEAHSLFNLMISQGIPPDKFTFPFLVKASFSVDRARETQALAIKYGFFNDIYVQHTLMDFYLKSGHLNCGRKLFDKMPSKNTISWTTMISGLTSNGDLETAQQLFDEMPIRNVVSWTTMINAYAKAGHPHKVFELFRRMQQENVKPNEFTLVGLLNASTKLGSLSLGRWVHDYTLKNKYPIGVFLGTALIDMYSKCGSLEDAKKVFDEMETKSIATWNAMITSLGVHSHGNEAIDLFLKLEKSNGIEPDEVTFVGILCACVRINDLDKANWYFKHMTEHYGIAANSEHFSCMIELYSEANMLDEVDRLVMSLPDSIRREVIASLVQRGKILNSSNPSQCQ
ncbi:pentatricopeptide repeat-containing protein At3g26630, chloroplastic-like [Impatiens glandulifera]|uniref:pentatricopeptide repeat-containing protein At3g26630, chloroplastic-like n=1 Tax=Impatiens glandulifera TaxID=253017 RepID=UPI001FB095E3|nr:pentatricopeptide repeat-containing protein At3g26630, chloroplastic-like [Impatiens glandulifera]